MPSPPSHSSRKKDLSSSRPSKKIRETKRSERDPSERDPLERERKGRDRKGREHKRGERQRSQKQEPRSQRPHRNTSPTPRGRSHSQSAPRVALQTDPPPALVTQSPALIKRTSHYIVLNKPAGWLTHTDGNDPNTGGRPNLVDWAQDRLGQRLRVHQRLDVSTSGVIALSLDTRGDQMIQEALARAGAKRYLAVVEGAPNPASGGVDVPVPAAPRKPASSRYRTLKSGAGWSLLEVTPLTGRTHQIRAHCAHLKTPIRGDARYGDPYDLRAPRALLHAHQLTLDAQTYTAPPPPCFARYLDDGLSPIESALNTRAELDASESDECYRILNGDVEGFSGWRIDRYRDWAWVIHDHQTPELFEQLEPHLNLSGVYHLDAMVDRSRGGQPLPELWRGAPAPKPLIVREAGVRYLVELGDQLSTGLFLDQRPQRAWLARAPRPWGRVLNTFAHAGGFSIAAAIAGAETVSVDLSGRWLERIPRQLELNDLDPRPHRCLTGDVFDWLRRLEKRGERFDLIILDPPSTSVGSKRKRWSAARDYPDLITLALPLLAPGGRLLTATNHRKLTPHKFVKLTSSVLPEREGFRLERVCAPGVDYPSDAPLGVKNLIWRAPS